MVELRVCCESGGFGLVLLTIVYCIHSFSKGLHRKKSLIQEQEQNECTRRTYGSSVLRSCSKFRSTQCKFS